MQIELFNPFRLVVPNAQCSRCLDTGVWLAPTNAVETCDLWSKTPHAPNPSAILLARSARRQESLENHINPFAFDLARILTHYTTDAPCLRLDLLEFFFADTILSGANRLRKFHALVEELRQVWLLPIGSRKFKPSGYWIITDLEDFKAWFNHRVKAAPVTQLTTIHHVAKYNFPLFAEQLEIEFFSDIKGESEAVNVN